MSLIPFNGADPSRIVEALHRKVDPNAVISLLLYCDAQSADRTDNWLIVQQVLSQPSVYAAFGISSLPQHFHFRSAHGLEVIGTVANLLTSHAVPGRFVDDFEVALSEARQFLDAFLLGSYEAVAAYSSDGAWCNWFEGEGFLDKTILVRHGNEWWILAVTCTD